MKIYLSIFFTIISLHLSAQADTATLIFKAFWEKSPLVLGEKLKYNSDSITIETFRFYISNIEFYKEQKLIQTASKKHHLIDIEKPSTLELQCVFNSKISFDEVKFNIGIDSFTNVSGVFGNDLDPTTGMYWTWQSGYINCKIEGTCASCNTRNKRFQLHIGGYQKPYNTLRKLALKNVTDNTIQIAISIDDFLNPILQHKHCEIMSPNNNAMQAASQFQSAFKFYNE